MSEVEHMMLRVDATTKRADETAVCPYCRKRDFVDNMIQVDTNGVEAQQTGLSVFHFTPYAVWAHTKCAGLRKCECGQHWVKKESKKKQAAKAKK